MILVDYPGFNLNIAKFVHSETQIPVFYYISPKIWAWKEYRIKNIKRDVDELFSILPFEVEFYTLKHRYPIHYVGNPTVDEVTAYQKVHPKNPEAFMADNNLEDKPIIALLAGSRKQEIKDNLPDMLKAASAFPDYQLVLAGAPGIAPEYYKQYVGQAKVKIIFDQTYRLLQHAEAALVTSVRRLLRQPCSVFLRWFVTIHRLESGFVFAPSYIESEIYFTGQSDCRP